MADGQPFYLIVADHDRGVFRVEAKLGGTSERIQGGPAGRGVQEGRVATARQAADEERPVFAKPQRVRKILQLRSARSSARL